MAVDRKAERPPRPAIVEQLGGAGIAGLDEEGPAGEHAAGRLLHRAGVLRLRAGRGFQPLLDLHRARRSAAGPRRLPCRHGGGRAGAGGARRGWRDSGPSARSASTAARSSPARRRAARCAARCISGPTIFSGRLTGAPRMGSDEDARLGCAETRAAARAAARALARLHLRQSRIRQRAPLAPEPRQARAVLGRATRRRPRRRAAGR